MLVSETIAQSDMYAGPFSSFNLPPSRVSLSEGCLFKRWPKILYVLLLEHMIHTMTVTAWWRETDIYYACLLSNGCHPTASINNCRFNVLSCENCNVLFDYIPSSTPSSTVLNTSPMSSTSSTLEAPPPTQVGVPWALQKAWGSGAGG